jgi:hypothetical protein
MLITIPLVPLVVPLLEAPLVPLQQKALRLPV